MPFNPINLPFSKELTIGKFMPQGWAFFTRSPREDNLYVYHLENSNWKLGTLPNSNYSLGAGRNMRVQGGEIAYLLTKVYSKKMVEFRGPLDTAKIAAMRAIPVVNTYLHPNICGEILVKAQPLVPWAWSKNKKIIMPYKLVKLNVICKP